MGTNVIRNFTTLGFVNQSRITDLKRQIAPLDYIEEFLKSDWPQSNITDLDEPFRQQLFANWITNNYDRFGELRTIHKSVLASNPQLGQPVKAGPQERKMVNPASATTTQLYGGSISAVTYNNTVVNVIIPEPLRYVLFHGWEQKPDIVKLLWQFAKDMAISPWIITPNGTEVIFKPPPPTSNRAKNENGYNYEPHSE